MKKLSLLLLGAILACTLSVSAFAGNYVNLSTGFTNNFWVNTVTFPLSTDLNLRTGFGLYVDSNRIYIPEMKVGLGFPTLWDLFLDFNFGDGGEIQNLLANYDITLGKRFSFKLTDQVSVGAEIAIFRYGYYGTIAGITANKHSFQFLSEIQPQISFNICM